LGTETTINVVAERPADDLLNAQEIVTGPPPENWGKKKPGGKKKKKKIGDYPEYPRARVPCAIRVKCCATRGYQPASTMTKSFEVVIVRTARKTTTKTNDARSPHSLAALVGTVFGDMMEGLEGRFPCRRPRCEPRGSMTLSAQIKSALPSLYLEAGQSTHGFAVSGQPISAGLYWRTWGRPITRWNKIAGWMLRKGSLPRIRILYTTAADL